MNLSGFKCLQTGHPVKIVRWTPSPGNPVHDFSFSPWIIFIIFCRLSDTYFISTSLLSGPSWRSDFAFREIFFNIFLQGQLKTDWRFLRFPIPKPSNSQFFPNFFDFPRLYFSLIFISPILLFYLTILNQRKNDGFTTTKPTHKTWDQSQSLKIFIHSCSETSECLFSWMKWIQISDKNIICSLKKMI